jgi:hypothetical protein
MLETFLHFEPVFIQIEFVKKFVQVTVNNGFSKIVPVLSFNLGRGTLTEGEDSVPWGKSAAIFRHQVAAWVPDLLCNFYLVKSHKIANNSATTEGREKISTDLKFFGICLTKFENYQILPNKISHRFPLTTKLFTGWKSLIDLHALNSLG